MSGHHHESGAAGMDTGKAFIAGTALNAAFVIAEFAAGWIYNSMGLLADAGHNLGDVGALALSLIAFRLARKRRTAHYTYGFRKSTILASLTNAVLLFCAAGAILWGCIQKLAHPTNAGGWPIIITAGIGILVNGATVLFFLRDRKRDLNVKGAFLHMIADTLVSVGVAFSGVVILMTGWTLADPLVGLAVAAAILISAWGLLKESLRLSLDGVPAGIEPAELRAHLMKIPGVEDIHHIHIWAVSTTENAFTAHVTLNGGAAQEQMKKALRAELAEHGITHTTLEFETAAEHCPDSGF